MQCPPAPERPIRWTANDVAVRELPKPPEIEGDLDATEMIRIWLAHNELCVSLLLGMWQDAADSEVDECDAWGELLSDVVKHISNGLQQSHSWDKAETASRIRDSLLHNLQRTDGVVEGSYWKE